MFLMTKKGWKSIFRRTLFSPTILILVALFSGCNPKEPEPIVIRETVVVEVPATVIVTQAPEQIEIEVTRVVKETIVFTPTPARTAVTTPTTTPTPSFFEHYPYGSYTDIPEVDDIARTILTRDTAAIRSLVSMHSLPCIGGNNPYGPDCEEGETEGSVIEAFFFAVCEGFFIRDEERIQAIIAELVERVTGVYAVYSYEQTDSSGEVFITYGIIFTTYQPSNALSIIVDERGIRSIRLGCAQTPDDILNRSRDAQLILPPISEVQNNN